MIVIGGDMKKRFICGFMTLICAGMVMACGKNDDAIEHISASERHEQTDFNSSGIDYSSTSLLVVSPEDLPDYSDYHVGDIIVFGTYEQDGNLENGAEPIEWIVINETDDDLLLMSKYILDAMAYKSIDDKTSWKTSELRRFLVGEFYESFEPIERSYMNGIQRDYIVPDEYELVYDEESNSLKEQYHVYTSTDMVSILHYDELFEYFEPVVKTSDSYHDRYDYAIWNIVPEVTQYAIDRGVGKWTIDDSYFDRMGFADLGYVREEWVGKTMGSFWILTDVGIDRGVSLVRDNGIFCNAGETVWVTKEEVGVRPIINIKKRR